jgi:protein-tyrosine phosphatase
MFDQIAIEKVAVRKIEEVKNRHLPFSGSKNFRDLGGYRTVDGRMLKWNLLYRSDSLHKLTDSDLRYLSTLMLDRIIDFRAGHEKEKEPDRLPKDTDTRLVEIPILDASTRVWHESLKELVKNPKNINPVKYLVQTNIELATRFTPEIKQFIHELLSASGHPVLFHCAAGKDRTGFAAAILLRILGVSHETVMEDYLLTNQYYLPAYRWNLTFAQLVKGKQFAAGIRGFMEARPAYLSAAFEAIDLEHGSFDNYVHKGLGLAEKDIERLKSLYLK